MEKAYKPFADWIYLESRNLGSLFLSRIDSKVNRFKFYHLTSFVIPFSVLKDSSYPNKYFYFKSSIQNHQMLDWPNTDTEDKCHVGWNNCGTTFLQAEYEVIF